MGRDDSPINAEMFASEFQPTRPLRGATLAVRKRLKPASRFQSTRPLRGATLAASHARWRHTEFQSTRPLRGATTMRLIDADALSISIHAPLAGRDVGHDHNERYGQ